MNLRHNNDAEVQPVPRVPQEGEGPDAEASRQDFDQRLKRINASKSVSAREIKRGRDEMKEHERAKHRDHERQHRAKTFSTFTVQQHVCHELEIIKMRTDVKILTIK